MKDGLLVGMALGLIVGVVLTKNSPEVKKIAEKTEKFIKDGVNKLKESNK